MEERNKGSLVVRLRRNRNHNTLFALSATTCARFPLAFPQKSSIIIKLVLFDLDFFLWRGSFEGSGKHNAMRMFALCASGSVDMDD